MTDVCIVCLGDLRVSSLENTNTNEGESDQYDAQALATTTAPLPMVPEESKNAVDEEVIAHLLPCGHNLHDSCLRPWVERANSCPICRANFNVVELRNFLDGPAHSSYAIQDKQQQADLDAALIIDDTLFDENEPCLVCRSTEDGHGTMYCDACDGTVHIFCAGYSTADAPDVWYCETCLRHIGRPTATTTNTRTRTARQRRTRPAPRPEAWDRVWASVWQQLNLDLDFPYDDEEPTAAPRTPTQRREFAAWNRRLHVADRQGAANRFRDTAPTLLRNPTNPPESQEELRAWNAFDKAKHFNDDLRPPSTRTSNRKRKSATNSPASPRESSTREEPQAERKLKRPRTRRNQEPGPSTEIPVRPAPPAPAPRPVEGPSFLTQLLQEVEKQPAPSEIDSADGEPMSGEEQQGSPNPVSPDGSPVHSGQASPRALSVTPPPQHPRPSSPTPLTSIVRPPTSPTFSPALNGRDSRGRAQRRPQHQVSSPPRGSSPGSPSRNMSYSTKTEIQRMVKAVLGPKYRDQEITKDQYTDINRDVSRMLYEKVGDAEGLADQKERERWQEYAVAAVKQQMEALQTEEES